MLVRLSELLRITMSHTGAPQTTLREEVAFLERYLDIEKIRFRNRLEVVIAVDEDAIDAQVPSLILQPMVENAMRHGIEPNARTGRIELRGARPRRPHPGPRSSRQRQRAFRPRARRGRASAWPTRAPAWRSSTAHARSSNWSTGPKAGCVCGMTIPFSTSTP